MLLNSFHSASASCPLSFLCSNICSFQKAMHLNWIYRQSWLEVLEFLDLNSWFSWKKKKICQIASPRSCRTWGGLLKSAQIKLYLWILAAITSTVRTIEKQLICHKQYIATLIASSCLIAEHTMISSSPGIEQSLWKLLKKGTPGWFCHVILTEADNEIQMSLYGRQKRLLKK